EHPSRIQIAFGETLPRDTVAVENLQMIEGLSDTFPAETIQGPEEHHIEPLESGIFEQRQERLPVRLGAAHAVRVLREVPALSLAILDQLKRLVGMLLPV